jgi:hypothetical protein
LGFDITTDLKVLILSISFQDLYEASESITKINLEMEKLKGIIRSSKIFKYRLVSLEKTEKLCGIKALVICDTFSCKYHK